MLPPAGLLPLLKTKQGSTTLGDAIIGTEGVIDNTDNTDNTDSNDNTGNEGVIEGYDGGADKGVIKGSAESSKIRESSKSDSNNADADANAGVDPVDTPVDTTTDTTTDTTNDVMKPTIQSQTEVPAAETEGTTSDSDSVSDSESDSSIFSSTSPPSTAPALNKGLNKGLNNGLLHLPHKSELHHFYASEALDKLQDPLYVEGLLGRCKQRAESIFNQSLNVDSNGNSNSNGNVNVNVNGNGEPVVRMGTSYPEGSVNLHEEEVQQTLKEVLALLQAGMDTGDVVVDQGGDKRNSKRISLDKKNVLVYENVLDILHKTVRRSSYGAWICGYVIM